MDIAKWQIILAGFFLFSALALFTFDVIRSVISKEKKENPFKCPKCGHQLAQANGACVYCPNPLTEKFDLETKAKGN